MCSLIRNTPIMSANILKICHAILEIILKGQSNFIPMIEFIYCNIVYQTAPRFMYVIR